jgi:DNA-binding transcriptional LysR family regulator
MKKISLAAGKFKREKTPHTLSISPSFAQKWLMPRLGDFYELYPDVTISLDKTLNNTTFKNDSIDAAVRFGDGNFEDLKSVYLFSPKRFAVASPAYIAKHGTLDDLSNPKQHRLINAHYGIKDIDHGWENLVAGDYNNLEQQLIILPDADQA